jgi:hypothetical protein
MEMNETLTVEAIEEAMEIEEAAGYEHGIMDVRDDDDRITHLADRDEVLWDSTSPSYRAGYNAGWKDGQPAIG